MNPYSVQIVWSTEDEAFLAMVGELPGCMADGETQEQALHNLSEVVAEWIATAKEKGRQIPPPLTKQDYEKLRDEMQRAAAAQFQLALQAAINEIVPRILEQHVKQQPVFPHELFSAQRVGHARQPLATAGS